MSEKRTCVFVLIAFLLIFNVPSILYSPGDAISRSLSSQWPALQSSMTLGAVLGFVSMVAALAVAVPAVTVAWITMVVVLAFSGKSKGDQLVEVGKIRKELAWLVGKVLLKEGNVVAVVCAVLGYFAVFKR